MSPHVSNADGSRFFGSPTKLFEYMAIDRAILASDLDQIGEVLAGSIYTGALPEPGTMPTGEPPAVLARPGSVEDIVAGLEFLASRPEWRNALGVNARRRALAKYTWQHHVGAILKRARQLDLVGELERA
jgi:glycosyltransferase involved in cell wall biosynthesis